MFNLISDLHNPSLLFHTYMSMLVPVVVVRARSHICNPNKSHAISIFHHAGWTRVSIIAAVGHNHTPVLLSLLSPRYLPLDGACTAPCNLMVIISWSRFSWPFNHIACPSEHNRPCRKYKWPNQCQNIWNIMANMPGILTPGINSLFVIWSY